MAHHELFAVKSSKPLSCAGTAITHYTVGAKLVTSQKYAQACLEGTTKLCQLPPSSTHYLTCYSNVSPSGHTYDLTEGSHKHLSGIKITEQFHRLPVSELKADCLKQTVPITGGHERPQIGEADMWEEFQEGPLAVCRQCELGGFQSCRCT